MSNVLIICSPDVIFRKCASAPVATTGVTHVDVRASGLGEAMAARAGVVDLVVEEVAVRAPHLVRARVGVGLEFGLGLGLGFGPGLGLGLGLGFGSVIARDRRCRHGRGWSRACPAVETDFPGSCCRAVLAVSVLLRRAPAEA